MAELQDFSRARIFVAINAHSGSCSPGDVCQALESRLGPAGLECHIHEIAQGDDIPAVVGRAVADGHDVVVAAGGDGTVSAVANGLIRSNARMGIIPLGTANVLARELGVPIDLGGACDILTGPGTTSVVDAMRVGGRHYFTQLGIGVDAAMIRDTTVERKKWLGIAAYLWTALIHFVGFRARRLSISADGRRLRPKAIQVLIANSGSLGSSGLRWGPDIRPDDGRIDVCILRARTLLDYLSVFWSVLLGRHREERNIQYLTASQAVAVHSDRPFPVQGDGELIGHTPIEVQVVPGALRVIVPARRADEATGTEEDLQHAGVGFPPSSS